MIKELTVALQNAGLIGTVGGGYKTRGLLIGDGTPLAQAYCAPLAGALGPMLGDRVLCVPEGGGALKPLLRPDFDPVSFVKLTEGDVALGAKGRPLVDLVNFVVTDAGMPRAFLPSAASLQHDFIKQGIAVVVTHLTTMGSCAEMRQHSDLLWPSVLDNSSIALVTLQHVDELLYGSVPKDRGRAVLSGWGVLPEFKSELAPRSSPSPVLGTFIEPELTKNRVGYLITILELAAKAGWDVTLVAPELGGVARRAIEKLLVEDGLQTDVDIIDKIPESQHQLVQIFANCDATVWLPDGEHAMGQDWRVAIGAAARKPMVVFPSVRTLGYREDAMGATAFAWADTGMDEIASVLYGIDPTTQDGAGPHSMWAGRVKQYAEARSWEARGEEVLVAWAKALANVEDERMGRVLENPVKRGR